MKYREINLLGGFYKDASLPWSSQDTVNWLPVPAQAEGTRSPMKLRGAPGLRALVRNANDLIGPAVWIYGTVNSEGGVSGNKHFYYVSDTAQTLASSAPVPIPAAMSATGSDPVTRISVANNVIFLHGSVSPECNAQVSTNGGLDWQQADHPLSSASFSVFDVYWNGSYYYWGKKYSPDGITWTDIPNFPFAGNPNSWIARNSDGAFVISSNSQTDVFVTLNNGATWLTRTSPFGTAGSAGPGSPMATNGTTLATSQAGSIGYGWSDDLFATAAVAAPGPAYMKVSGGIWLGARAGSGINLGLRRSLDGKTWETVDTVDALNQPLFNPNVATDGGTWAFVKYISPGVFRLRLSVDGAVTWTDGAALPGAGNIIYRGLP